jgi:hypothetical protein
MRSLGLATFLSIALIAGAARSQPAKEEAPAAPVPPTSPKGWSDAAKGDIEAAYQALLGNHPGVVDPQNPEFASRLSQARANGLALAAKSTDSLSYIAAINKFGATFRDGHAGAFIPDGKITLPPRRWPGFVPAWRGDSMVVYASEPGGPQVGSKIESCDGKTIRQLVLDNVYTFEGKPDEAGDWWARARNAFIDRANPYVTPPRRCKLSFNDHRSEFDLTWRTEDKNTSDWRVSSYNGESLSVGMTEPRAKLFWIAIPTFEPNEQERASYREMFKDITENRGRILGADAIVIDLRQNQGGASDWPRNLAKALWGDGRVQRRLDAYSSNVEIWWRASQGNTDYATKMIGVLRAQGQDEFANELDGVGKGLKLARVNGKTFYVQRDPPSSLTLEQAKKDVPSDPPALTVPVYVIVPGQCASSCLDALDDFTQFSNVKLVGAPSSADSTYLEVRTEPLPSGLAAVIIPAKVYVHRPRASGQIYNPAILVSDLDWSTATFQRVIEADLTTRRR